MARINWWYIFIRVCIPETCPGCWDRIRERKRSHFVIRNNESPSIRGASWPENTGSLVDPWFLVHTIDRQVPRSDRKSLYVRLACIPRWIRSTRIAGTHKWALTPMYLYDLNLSFSLMGRINGENSRTSCII